MLSHHWIIMTVIIRKQLTLIKILIFSLLLFFFTFLAFRECWLAKPILFQPTRKFKTSHLDKAKNYLENTEFKIVFSELDSFQIRTGFQVLRTCPFVRVTLVIIFYRNFIYRCWIFDDEGRNWLMYISYGSSSYHGSNWSSYSGQFNI